MSDVQNNSHRDICYFGETNFRNRPQKFGIKIDDRRRHMYVIGKTGMGKTVLLENMVIQDIRNGHGVAYVDPHGDTAEKLLEYIPKDRINDVIYFYPGDLKYPIGFNILEAVDFEYRHLVASSLMSVFTKIWADVWSSRMEYILNNTLLALLEVHGNTLLGVMRMYSDKGFRKQIVSRLRDPLVKSFWIDQFANWSENYRREAVSAIENKVGQFLSSSIVRNIVGQTKSTIDMRDIMDEGKILIMNLSKGRIGDDASALLGGMLITRIQTAAMSRVDTPEDKRKDFFLYVDEFQNFSTKSFAEILSEARKYRLSLILVHQYIAQLSEEVRDAVFGNVGTMITMRIGVQDAEYIVREYEPVFTVEDLVNLPKWKVFLKLMIDGNASQPFSADTLPPMYEGTASPENIEKVIRVSRERYAKPASDVEEKIMSWIMSGREDDENNKDVEKKKNDPEPNAICDYTLKPIHIKFSPDGKRNVFSPEALEKFKEGEIDISSLPHLNPVSTEILNKYIAKKITPDQLKEMAKNGYANQVNSEVVNEKKLNNLQVEDVMENKKKDNSKVVGVEKENEVKNEQSKDKDKKVLMTSNQQVTFHNDHSKRENKNKNGVKLMAICDNCRKKVEIHFQPDASRNVFCKDCLSKFKLGEFKLNKLKKLNIAPVPEHVDEIVSENTSQISLADIPIQDVEAEVSEASVLNGKPLISGEVVNFSNE